MPKRSTDRSKAVPSKHSAAEVAAQIRGALRDGGSAEHAVGVQWFFQEAIKSRGWYTADLRRAAVDLRRQVRKDHGLDFLVEVADQLFSGSVLEEKVAAVFLLEGLDRELGEKEFKLFDSWLDRISSWADHDALVHDLIAPMILSKPHRARIVFRWAKSPKRWRRRAACVALVRGARVKLFFSEITRLSDLLLSDQDDMVQKGLGWLLRETAKFDRKQTVRYLTKIRGRATRLVLRTACETLPRATRKRILAI
ncbi:MAG: DNA alkylation repair protein [Candidatus Sulfotelmatobacter sp.]